jgi:hypothetical protein
MKRITLTSLTCLSLLTVLMAASFAPLATAATPNPNSAVVKEKIFHDCPGTTTTIVNNYPALLSIEDANLACIGGANLSNWSFSTDGVNQALFDNNADYRVSTDLVITGTGNGESGLRLSVWYSPDVDGRFNVRSTDGEIACFGGRVPFYSFTAAYGLHYVKGNPIHLEMTYKPNGLAVSSPATIKYSLTYQGTTYSSPELNFDEANPSEDPPHGVWGELNEARVGGYMQSFMAADASQSVKATYTNIRFVICPDAPRAVVKYKIFHDCPSTTTTAVNNYPTLVSIEDANLSCIGGANLTNWTFSDGLGTALNNNSDFSFSADLVIDGTGNLGESGLRLSPWWSQDVDGRFNVRVPDGEIACFGGRLPFYTFTGVYGLHYVKGDPIHLGIVYKPNGLSSTSPATIEYKLTYLGNSYTSGPLPFDEANPAEDPPHGLWGILNEARAGGYLQSVMAGNSADAIKATYTNIQFQAAYEHMAVDVTPNSINFQSNGSFVKAKITPAAPYLATGIVVNTLRLNGQVGPDLAAGTEIDGNTLVVSFNRLATQKAIGGTGTATVTGEIAGVCFSGSDAVKVVNVTSPTAGSTHAGGSVVNVQWTTPEATNVLSAAIYASTDEGATWQTVAENLANSGSYAWTIPGSLGGTARVAVVLDDGTSDGVAGISDAFTITSPVGVGGPAAVEFALSGVKPNPSNGNGIHIGFSLPDSRRATLALYDVSGRRVVFREVGEMGAGRHTVTLARGLPAGLYVVRLSQGGRSLSTRAAVVE